MNTEPGETARFYFVVAGPRKVWYNVEQERKGGRFYEKIHCGFTDTDVVYNMRFC